MVSLDLGLASISVTVRVGVGVTVGRSCAGQRYTYACPRHTARTRR
jgi:hypothetical protein